MKVFAITEERWRDLENHGQYISGLELVNRLRAEMVEVDLEELDNELDNMQTWERPSTFLLARMEPTRKVEAPQEAPMKCMECDGRGFIEHRHGLVQAQCTACHGIGTLPDGPPKEAEHADIDHGIEEPDKPARKPYTRKSRKPRQPPKSR